MRIGVDLGGTKIEGVALDRSGVIRARRRIPTPGGYAPGLEAIAALVDALEAETGEKARAVGVGMPGSASPATGLLRNANSTWLNGRPFETDLAGRLARPVRTANDANCFALSEAVDGAGAGAAVVFGVILGTGCGGGIVANGQLLGGAAGIAGEWGHTPLPWPDAGERAVPPCWCGRTGCLETFLSGPAIAADHRRHGGADQTLQSIAAAAAAGDAVAAATLDRFFDRLARGLAVIVNVLDPDVIVFGGGVSNLDALYGQVPARLGPHVFSDMVATRLVRNKHGDSSGVRGAAWLWRADEIA